MRLTAGRTRLLRPALDNADGDRLYAVQWKEAKRHRAQREAAKREAQRPVCTRCGAGFTDERWQLVKRSSWPEKRDDLCGPCVTEAASGAEAERVARRQAEEAERAAAETPAVNPRGRFGITRRR
ncbi:hypothetical protein [Streptomyces sp. NPDC021356]|uniref:hypothetical protein n=1 Tax=Streptomyces sp. NPDC021356 TaxID=3154900 RepID=UPI0034041401